MKVRVLLFGPYADAAGADGVECDLPDGARVTAADIIEALRADAPTLETMLPAARLAVNQRLATPEQVVAESDELALIGLVGGG